MKCPVCVEPHLVIAERQGIEIDYCPSCRGVWLDRVQQAVLEAQRAVDAVQEVNQDMVSIEHGSRETDEMLQRIAASIEQQSAALEEINANLRNVDQIAGSNATASEEITATVLELARLADGTRKEVQRFKLRA